MREKEMARILHHDVSSCNALLQRKFERVKTLLSLFASLASCDFFLFPKVKSVLKETSFASVEDVNAKTTELLKSCRKRSAPLL
jgi:hypothetical protein